ncbi:Gfo/Idh/MocA family protein [Microbacterium murale]|uniref:Dehydrogenase n=1 Tax=Microbacterium murale TaxID=1081040 RepID=A0ABQ1RH09_9MICO|nr:Gfo/Idh/MocA family oxidoreductase [Microbacterium murale]GGD70194.1 dehydrogenase [Microbacterium murale]
MTQIHRPFRLALVGPGRIAEAHLEAVTAASDVAQLIAIAGVPDEIQRTTELQQRFGARRSETTVQAIIEADDVDAVILTVPNHLHAPLAIPLLEAGKHVLIEKPLATRTADALAIAAAADEHQRVAMVAHCRRFFDGAQAAHRFLSEPGRGPASTVHYLGVYADHAATAWWKSAADTGGLAIGLNGPHSIDTSIWLTGSRPVRVYARNLRLRDLWEGEDEATIIVDFEDGSTAVSHLSLNARPAVNQRWINTDAHSLYLEDDRRLRINGEQIVDEATTPYIHGDNGFRSQLREFLSALAEGRQPSSSARSTLPVVQVMEAAHLSNTTGLPVELDVSVAGIPSDEGAAPAKPAVA